MRGPRTAMKSGPLLPQLEKALTQKRRPNTAKDKYKNKFKKKKRNFRDFPGGAVVKNPPANAGGRFEPCSGKIPHATEQLSPCVTTTEPASHSY